MLRTTPSRDMASLNRNAWSESRRTLRAKDMRRTRSSSVYLRFWLRGNHMYPLRCKNFLMEDASMSTPFSLATASAKDKDVTTSFTRFATCGSRTVARPE